MMRRDALIVVAWGRGPDLEAAVDLPGIGAHDLDRREARDMERDLALPACGSSEEDDGKGHHETQRRPKRRSSSSIETRTYVGRPCGSP